MSTEEYKYFTKRNIMDYHRQVSQTAVQTAIQQTSKTKKFLAYEE